MKSTARICSGVSREDPSGRLPIRLLGSPVFGLAIDTVEAEHDLANVVRQRRHGVDDDRVLPDFHAGRPVEPVHRLGRHAPGEDRLLTNLQGKAGVGRAAAPDACVEKIADGDLLEGGFAVCHCGSRQYSRIDSVC